MQAARSCSSNSTTTVLHDTCQAIGGLQLVVEAAQAASDRVDALIEAASSWQRSQLTDHPLTGHITGMMTAHAIGDRPAAALRAIQQCILIAHTALALRRASGTLPRLRPTHNCSGRRKVRHVAIWNGLGLRWLVSR